MLISRAASAIVKTDGRHARQRKPLIRLVAMHVYGVIIKKLKKFFHMLTESDQLYIFDEFYYDMTNRIYFTHPAASAKNVHGYHASRCRRAMI